MYFRGDETFYRELGAALDEVRHRERWKIRFRETGIYARRKFRGLKRRIRRMMSRRGPTSLPLPNGKS
jgi:hypothetical protein